MLARRAEIQLLENNKSNGVRTVSRDENVTDMRHSRANRFAVFKIGWTVIVAYLTSARVIVRIERSSFIYPPSESNRNVIQLPPALWITVREKRKLVDPKSVLKIGVLIGVKIGYRNGFQNVQKCVG